MDLTAWMAEAGWSNAALAKELGVAENSVARWRNKWRRPRADEMARIRALSGGKVTPNDFFAHPRRVPKAHGQSAPLRLTVDA